MHTQDDIDIQTTPAPSSPQRSRGKRWLTGLVVLLVIVLVVGASAVIFAQLVARQGHMPPGNGPGTGPSAPPAGQWASVLSGYQISSLVAARSNPAVLYLCATPTNSPSSSSAATYTILRSSDFGTHWQNVGSKAGLGNSCQVTVNPANSDDIYVVGAPAVDSTGSVAAPYMLWHSTNGGQTWTVILAALHAPSILTATAWQVQQLSVEGRQLYGLQSFPGQSGVSPRQGVKAAIAPMTRLVMSVDGGHSWTVVDSQLISTNQGVRDYAIDPAQTRTMYVLVGASFLAPIVQSSDTHVLQPAYAYNESLYKTTDGGATWHLLLGKLPFSSLLRLATGNPQVLYVGGAVGPIPYAANASAPAYTYPVAVGLFQLHVSADGGASWKLATSARQILLVKGWFVGPDGQAFLVTAGKGSILPSAQTTPVVGTVVAGGPSVSSGGSTGQAGLVQLAPVTTAPPEYELVKSYEPATNTWKDVTTTPSSGVLFALTPSGAKSGAILWLLGSNNASPILYRYIAA